MRRGHWQVATKSERAANGAIWARAIIKAPCLQHSAIGNMSKIWLQIKAWLMLWKRSLKIPIPPYFLFLSSNTKWGKGEVTLDREGQINFLRAPEWVNVMTCAPWKVISHKYILQFQQIHFTILTNIYLNNYSIHVNNNIEWVYVISDKFVVQSGKIYFTIWTNWTKTIPIHTTLDVILDKYILWLEQGHFAI